VRLGKFDKRFTFQQATETPNDFGDMVLSWSDLKTVFGWFRKASGGDQSSAGEERASSETFLLTVRLNSALIAVNSGRTFRVVRGLKAYDIQSSEEIYEGRRRGYLLFTLKARDDG